MAPIVFWSANALTAGSGFVNAPSRKAGSENRFVVAIGTVSPVSSSTWRKRPTIRSRSAALASIGTKSLSCRLTPIAPKSASRRTVSAGSTGARVGSPNGSRPVWPTVHSPNVKRSAGEGAYKGMGVGDEMLRGLGQP